MDHFERAIEEVEKHLRLHCYDHSARRIYHDMLLDAGREDEAESQLDAIECLDAITDLRGAQASRVELVRGDWMNGILHVDREAWVSHFPDRNSHFKTLTACRDFGECRRWRLKKGDWWWYPSKSYQMGIRADRWVCSYRIIGVMLGDEPHSRVLNWGHRCSTADEFLVNAVAFRTNTYSSVSDGAYVENLNYADFDEIHVVANDGGQIRTVSRYRVVNDGYRYEAVLI